MKHYLCLFLFLSISLSLYADDSGSCGENVIYAYDASNKTLTISGTGNMTNYSISYHKTPWDDYLSEITTLIISEGVTSIGDYAFYNCTNLGSISISNSVTSIGKYSFEGSKSLISIDIPNSVEEIGKCAFEGCINLKSFIIPNSVSSIEAATFAGCKNLTSVSIPDNVEEIGESAFRWCSGLVKVHTGNVKNIYDHAFSDCDALYSISFGRISYIGLSVFSGCNNLKEVHVFDIASWCSAKISDNPIWKAHNLYINDELVTDLIIPEGVTTITDGIFHQCNNIKSVSLPKSLKIIEMSAFQMCDGLTSVYFEEGLEKLSMQAFDRCANLKNVYIKDLAAWCKVEMPYNDVFSYPYHLYLNGSELKNLVIPSGTQAVGSSIFRNCISINSVTFDNSVSEIGEYAFQNCSELKHVILPENLKLIRKQAFQKCNLEELIIPSTVEIIYPEVFDNCYNIKKLETLALTPPLLYENTFSNYNIPLTVPKGCIDKYIAQSPWNKFKDIKEHENSKYKLTYIVDGELYKTIELEEGEVIIPEATPSKEGNIFSGWSEIPAIMPAHDVTVKGIFFKKGDANGDNIVNAADIVEVVNFIMENPSEKFNNIATNINGDSNVNAADIVLIVNAIIKPE